MALCATIRPSETSDVERDGITRRSARGESETAFHRGTGAPKSSSFSSGDQDSATPVVLSVGKLLSPLGISPDLPFVDEDSNEGTGSVVSECA